MSTPTANRPAPHSGGGAAPDQVRLAHTHRATLGLHPNLTPQQRRVVATFAVTYLGTDAKDRPVVEALVGIPQASRTWAVLRSGDPTDVVHPVRLAHREVRLPVLQSPPSRQLAARRHLAALQRDYCAECQPEGDPARYVLVEANTSDGSWFLTYCPSPEAAADYHDTQEHPELWEAKVLVDLETGQRWVGHTETVHRTTWQ